MRIQTQLALMDVDEGGLDTPRVQVGPNSLLIHIQWDVEHDELLVSECATKLRRLVDGFEALEGVGGTLRVLGRDGPTTALQLAHSTQVLLRAVHLATPRVLGVILRRGNVVGGITLPHQINPVEGVGVALEILTQQTLQISLDIQLSG